MHSKVSIKLLVEYEEPDLPSGDRLRSHFGMLTDCLTDSDFSDAIVTCLSIERDGKRVID